LRRGGRARPATPAHRRPLRDRARDSRRALRVAGHRGPRDHPDRGRDLPRPPRCETGSTGGQENGYDRDRRGHRRRHRCTPAALAHLTPARTEMAQRTKRAGASETLLVGDIGGTRTRLALYEFGGTRLISEAVVPSREHRRFEDIARSFLRTTK